MQIEAKSSWKLFCRDFPLINTQLLTFVTEAMLGF